MLIRSLQSAVEREQALSKFSRRWMSGKLLGVADIYIPYRLYKVNLEDRRVRTARLLAIDAISGNLDPFEFSESPLQNRCTDMETRNYLPAQLSEPETHVAALAKFRRLLFSAGFFRLAKPVISSNWLSPLSLFLIGPDFTVKRTASVCSCWMQYEEPLKAEKLQVL